jgi:DNA polymerase (family 10)
MANEKIAEILTQMAFFAELGGENPFKVRAWQKAAGILEDQEKSCEELIESGEIKSIPGIGKGTQAIVQEFVSKGEVAELEDYKKKFPAKITELLKIRGLGPKKIQQLYQELNIGSISELEYACHENRLLDLKGFGKKTQESLMKQMETMKAHRGKVIYPVAEQEAEQWKEIFSSWDAVARVEETGEFRRRMPVIGNLDFLLQGRAVERSLEKEGFQKSEVGFWQFQNEDTIPVRAWIAEEKNFGSEWFRTTGPKSFLEEWGSIDTCKNEEEVFARKNSSPLPAETRDLGLAKKELLQLEDIRGVFHLHTNWSDGKNTLEEMVEKALELGLEYLGVSDHSKTAFYANGLEVNELKKQKEEIAKVQKKYPQIKIFHGIESDILNDGSLDYEEKDLEQFDFVIASIHGQMKMAKEDMTKRICTALKNPHTTWLGHWSGRLLLGREGFDFDQQKVLETAAKYGKSIELNANPYRLDIDWQILPKAVELGIPIGVFPDAHSTRGLEDIKYGVMMARKAGLTKKDVINTKSRKEMEAWLLAQKKL